MVSKSYLLKPKKPKKPLPERLGAMLLLLTFVAMLAGRFSLNRLSSALPSTDLRYGFAFLLVTVGLLWLTVSHQYLPKPAKLAGGGLFVAWAGWMITSSAWAPKGARVADTVEDLIFLLFFILVAWTLMRLLPAEATERVWNWMLVGALIYFVLAVADGPGDQGRYAAPGGGPNVFVRVMILGAIAALYFASAKKRMWPLLTIPLFTLGAALSGSRGGLLSAGIVIALFAIPIATRLGAKRFIGVLLILVAAVGYLSAQEAVVTFVDERYIQQTLIEGYSSGRDTITEDAIRLYYERPIIGTGIDGFWVLQDVPEQFEYPHNLFIAALAEGGTIGGGLLMLTICWLALVAWKQRPLPHSALYALGGGMFLAFTSLFSGDYYDTRLMWFFLGLAVVEAGRQRDAAAAEAPKRSVSPAASLGTLGNKHGLVRRPSIR